MFAADPHSSYLNLDLDLNHHQHRHRHRYQVTGTKEQQVQIDIFGRAKTFHPLLSRAIESTPKRKSAQGGGDAVRLRRSPCDGGAVEISGVQGGARPDGVPDAHTSELNVRIT